jgi:hypothetical protein
VTLRRLISRLNAKPGNWLGLGFLLFLVVFFLAIVAFNITL